MAGNMPAGRRKGLPFALASLALIVTSACDAGGESANSADRDNAETVAAPDAEAEKAAIRAVIETMQAAWNRGDFEGYMEGFENPGVVFVSRGRFQDDWQGTLDHYRRDYGGSVERRGKLHFYDIEIEMLAPDTAQLISRFHLDRPEVPQYGVNTRLMRKIDGRWVIALNHVSAVETPDPADPVPDHR